MGLYEGRGNLNKSLKDLMLKWDATKLDWSDEVAEQFEATYLQPLDQALKQAVSAMDHMAQIMSRVDRDCK
jgi:hypothetical protein